MDLVQLYIDEKKLSKSEKTIINYNVCLRQFEGVINKPVEQAIKADIISYLSHLSNVRKLKKSSIATYQVQLCTFYKWLRENEYITSDPCAKIDKIKPDKRNPIWLTADEIKLMLDYTSVYKREHLIIKLFLDTGIRISELLTLKKTDIDFDRRTIKVFGKGAKERIVIFSEELKPELKEYVDGFKSEQLVFDLCPATVEHNIKDIARIVGINKKVTPHKLRHSFATLSLQRGMNIVQVQMLLGHSSLNTTEIYTHYGHDELKDAYDKSRSTN